MECRFILFAILAILTAHAHSICPEGTNCRTSKGENGVCREETCILIPAGGRADLNFAIIVKYPEETLQVIGYTRFVLSKKKNYRSLTEKKKQKKNST